MHLSYSRLWIRQILQHHFWWDFYCPALKYSWILSFLYTCLPLILWGHINNNSANFSLGKEARVEDDNLKPRLIQRMCRFMDEIVLPVCLFLLLLFVLRRSDWWCSVRGNEEGRDMRQKGRLINYLKMLALVLCCILCQRLSHHRLPTLPAPYRSSLTCSLVTKVWAT